MVSSNTESMNPILIDYILNWLAPAEYKLELKDRLENLCYFSGTPMSPGLHQWVTDKFGLEMTKVIEDYSTFASPKLSPELLSVVDRIVPSNYQGYDANLGLKQLFDVSCCDNFRYAIIGSYQGTASDFTGWTINGVDFETNYQSEFASAGCNTNTPYTNDSALGTSYEIIVWYYGTNDPVFNILNDLADPVILNWKSLCTKTCYETIVPQTDTVIPTFDVMGPEFVVAVDPRFTFTTTNPDVSIPGNVAAIQAYYRQCCGAATTVTSVTDINGDYVVTISNAYVAFPPVWSTSGSGQVYFYEITCP